MLNKRYKSHSPPGIVAGKILEAPVAPRFTLPPGYGCCNMNTPVQIPPGVLQTFYYKPRNGITSGPPAKSQQGGKNTDFYIVIDSHTNRSNQARILLNGRIFPDLVKCFRVGEIVPVHQLLTKNN